MDSFLKILSNEEQQDVAKEDSVDVKETLPEKQDTVIQQPTESTYSSSFDFIKEHHKIINKEELERKFNTLSTERKKDLVERTEGPYKKLKSQFDYYIENSKMMKEDYSSLQESLDSFLKILSNEEQQDVAIEQTDETSPKKNLSSKLKERADGEKRDEKKSLASVAPLEPGQNESYGSGIIDFIKPLHKIDPEIIQNIEDRYQDLSEEQAKKLKEENVYKEAKEVFKKFETLVQKKPRHYLALNTCMRNFATAILLISSPQIEKEMMARIEAKKAERGKRFGLPASMLSAFLNSTVRSLDSGREYRRSEDRRSEDRRRSPKR